MKPGLKAGQTAELEVKVGREMVAAFGGVTVHGLYSTSWLVHHMEWVARKTIVPYLEPDEEGVGCGVQVAHIMPTIPGMTVTLKATVSDIRGNKVVCQVEAFNPRGKIACGSVTQAVVGKDWLSRKIDELSPVHPMPGHSESPGPGLSARDPAPTCESTVRPNKRKEKWSS